MCQCDGENASCKGSSRPGQPSGSCPCTRPPTTSLPFLVISSLLARTASSAPKRSRRGAMRPVSPPDISRWATRRACARRSEEHTSELQSRQYLVCRLLLDKKKKTTNSVSSQNKKTKKNK